MSSQGRLNGRAAIVTGAAKGIGKATAFKMAQEGASVIIVDILSQEMAQVERGLSDQGLKARGIVGDISDRSQVNRVVDEAIREFGTVDILVNNAGIVHPALLEDVEEEDWDKVVSVNLKGSFHLAQAIAPLMKRNRYGKIVNIGSRASLGKSERTVYAATKAGLIGMTRTWALELAPYNINVNYVGPGPIATELFQSVNPPESEKTKAIMRAIPLQRMGKPEDVANLISFLSSDEAAFITGQAIFICGGMTVGLAHY